MSSLYVFTSLLNRFFKALILKLMGLEIGGDLSLFAGPCSPV